MAVTEQSMEMRLGVVFSGIKNLMGFNQEMNSISQTVGRTASATNVSFQSMASSATAANDAISSAQKANEVQTAQQAATFEKLMGQVSSLGPAFDGAARQMAVAGDKAGLTRVKYEELAKQVEALGPEYRGTADEIRHSMDIVAENAAKTEGKVTKSMNGMQRSARTLMTAVKTLVSNSDLEFGRFGIEIGDAARGFVGNMEQMSGAATASQTEIRAQYAATARAAMAGGAGAAGAGAYGALGASQVAEAVRPPGLRRRITQSRVWGGAQALSTTGIGVAAAVLGGAYFAGKKAVEQEDQQRLTQQQYGLSEKQLKQFVDFSRSHATDLLQTQSDMLTSLGTASLVATKTVHASGMQAIRDSEQIASGASKLAVTFGSTVPTTVKIAQGQLASFRKDPDVKNLPHFFDILYAGMQRSGKGAEAFSGPMGRAATMAAGVGVHFKEFITLVANMNREMPQLGPRAGMMVSALMTHLAKPGPALAKLFANGMDDVQKVINVKKFGIVGSIKNVLALAAKDTKAGQKTLAQQLETAAFGSPQIQTIAQGLVRGQKQYGSLTNVRGGLDTGFGRVANDTANQFKKMQLYMEDMTLTVGRVVLPIMHQLLGAFLPFLHFVSDYIQKNPQLIRQIIAVGIAIGTFALAFKALNLIMTANPFLLLLAGLVLLYENWKPFRQFVNAAFADLKKFAGWLSTSLPQAWHSVTKALSEVVSWLGKNWKLVLLGMLLFPFLGLIIFFKTLGPTILRAITAVAQGVLHWLQSNWKTLLTSAMLGPFLFIPLFILQTFFPHLRTNLVNALGKIAGGIISWAGKLVSDFGSFGRRMITTFINVFIKGPADLLRAMVTWFSKALKWWGQLELQAATWALNMITAFEKTIINDASNLVTQLTNWFSAGLKWFLGLASTAISWGSGLVGGFIKGILSLPGKLASAGQTIASSIFHAIVNFFKNNNPFSGIVNMAKGLPIVGGLLSALGGKGRGAQIGSALTGQFTPGSGPVSSSMFAFQENSETPGPASMAGVANAVEHTDMQVAAGTPFKLPGDRYATYKLVDKYRSPEWGNTLTFMTPNDGRFDFMHMRSMSGVTIGGVYHGGTYLGTSGGVPGIDTDQAHSSGAHLHFGADAPAYGYIWWSMRGKGFDAGVPMTGAYGASLDQASPNVHTKYGSTVQGGLGRGAGKPRTVQTTTGTTTVQSSAKTADGRWVQGVNGPVWVPKISKARKGHTQKGKKHGLTKAQIRDVALHKGFVQNGKYVPYIYRPPDQSRVVGLAGPGVNATMKPWVPMLVRYANRYNIDPAFLASVAGAESTGFSDPNEGTSTVAMGLDLMDYAGAGHVPLQSNIGIENQIAGAAWLLGYYWHHASGDYNQRVEQVMSRWNPGGNEASGKWGVFHWLAQIHDVTQGQKAGQVQAHRAEIDKVRGDIRYMQGRKAYFVNYLKQHTQPWFEDQRHRNNWLMAATRVANIDMAIGDKGDYIRSLSAVNGKVNGTPVNRWLQTQHKTRVTARDRSVAMAQYRLNHFGLKPLTADTRVSAMRLVGHMPGAVATHNLAGVNNQAVYGRETVTSVNALGEIAGTTNSILNDIHETLKNGTFIPGKEIPRMSRGGGDPRQIGMPRPVTPF